MLTLTGQKRLDISPSGLFIFVSEHDVCPHRTAPAPVFSAGNPGNPGSSGDDDTKRDAEHDHTKCDELWSSPRVALPYETLFVLVGHARPSATFRW